MLQSIELFSTNRSPFDSNSVFVDNLVSFYDYFKWESARHFPEQTLSMIHLGSAITAGALSDFLCNPMFVVRTRLQTESLHHNASFTGNKGPTSSKHTIQQTVQMIYAEGGFNILERHDCKFTWLITCSSPISRVRKVKGILSGKQS